MTVSRITVNSAEVVRDTTLTHRWFDANGLGVIKYLQEFATWPHDDTTKDPTEWEVTVVEAGAGTSTAVITDQAGGALLITCAANEDDGWSMQLGGAAGENIKLDASYPLYVGVKVKSNDADQSDLLVGVAVTDTALLGGVTDGMYFRSPDASGAVYFVTEKNSVESATAVATMVDDTYMVLEFLFDGSTVSAYVDGVFVSETASAAATFPDDEEMRLSLEYLTGEAIANTCTVEWLRMIYVR